MTATAVTEASRDRERFLAMVAHELRNALTAVHGWGRMIRHPSARITREDATDELLRATGDALRFIDDLLDLSRLDEQRLRPRIAECHPVDIARYAGSRFRLDADAARVHLVIRNPEMLPRIQTDAQRVEQILGNLIINAIRHSPPGGIVHVDITCDDSSVCYEVSDGGAGVSHDDADRIFEPYQRGAGGDSGVGLGLVISRRLATVLGGSLTVSPGAGGRFTLTLPATAVP